MRTTSAALSSLFLVVAAEASQCIDSKGDKGDCRPGREFCGKPFGNLAPQYHLMDQHGCGENDPNGPSFDPVHGVFHHFYQIHLAASPGHGPDYGHFVSKDFVHWAQLPVAIWNGLDKGHSPGSDGYITLYDNEAIFTGSGVVVDGAGPDGNSPGLIQIYPGLCNKNDWPLCETGTLLAQAVPADYAGDQLLVNWTKPSYNPIMENTQRDPSTPWQTSAGEWRLRTYDSSIYGAASAKDMINGKWYKIGVSKDLRTCECPSLYPLPGPTPGFEASYRTAQTGKDGLPSHVHKTSCEGDWWQVGTYLEGLPRKLGTFKPTPGWEDTYEQRRIDMGDFYASKDNLYPSRDGVSRRINWGWAMVQPGSAQTLPREITFNAEARVLQQYPTEEIEELRGDAVYSKSSFFVEKDKPVATRLSNGIARQSEMMLKFELPTEAATIDISLGDGAMGNFTTYMINTNLPGSDYNVTHFLADTDPKVCEDACNADPKCKAWTYVIRGLPAGSGDCCLKSSIPCPDKSSSSSDKCTSGVKAKVELPRCGGCSLEWRPNFDKNSSFVDVPVSCGNFNDRLRILSSEKNVEIRLFSDMTFFEVYFQRGRTVMTVSSTFNAEDDYYLASSASIDVNELAVYPMKSPWITPEKVRSSPRIYKL